jgi:fructose-1-phosphate kinase PfkB-like protein
MHTRKFAQAEKPYREALKLEPKADGVAIRLHQALAEGGNAAEAEAFVERLDYLARGAAICVLAGSLPPGIEPDFYARLIEILKGHGVTVVLDTEGQAMSAGIKAGPSMITPNRVEAEELIGREVESRTELAEALTELTGLGSAEAAVTLPEGCLAIVGEGADRRVLEATIDPLEPISRGGSGDAFVAGYVAAIYDGKVREESLPYGVACGAESTQHLGAGWVDRLNAERLLDDIALAAEIGFTVVRLDVPWAEAQPRAGAFDGDVFERVHGAAQAARSAGLQPWFRLLQPTVPWWFDNEGGFTDDGTAGHWWPRWVELAAERLGDVSDRTPFNG